MIVPAIASALISVWQWRSAYLVLSITTVIVMVAVSQFLKGGPTYHSMPKSAGQVLDSLIQETKGLLCEKRSAQAICLGLFALFLISLCAGFHHGASCHSHHRAGYSSDSCCLHLIAHRGACIVGMNVMGNIADRFGNKIGLGLSYSLMGLSLVWLIPSRSEWSFYLFSIAFGFAYGGMQVLFSPLVAELFGTRSHGVILAAGALIGSIGAAVGPIVAGYVFDSLGSYTIAFILCAMLAFAGLVSTLLLQKTPQG